MAQTTVYERVCSEYIDDIIVDGNRVFKHQFSQVPYMIDIYSSKKGSYFLTNWGEFSAGFAMAMILGKCENWFTRSETIDIMKQYSHFRGLWNREIFMQSDEVNVILKK